MRGKRKLFFMFLALCLMLAIRPETASAADGSISVNGTDILSATNHQVSCGSGAAAYEPDTKVLRLDNAVIGSLAGSSVLYGVEITEPGVTVELIGENTINAHYGIWSEHPLTIKGTNGSRLSINTAPSSSLPTFSCAGIHVQRGGLTIRDTELQLAIGKMSDASAYGIVSKGSDNLISNSKIKIAMNSLADPDMKCIGINMSGADSLTVTNNSSITMESLDTGISFYGNLNISGSSLTIKESAMHGVVAGKTEISGGSVLDISAQDGQALQAAGKKITISDSSATLVSTGTNGIFCNDLEIIDSSKVDVKGYWPALFVDNNTVIRDSSVDAVTTNDVGIFCKGPTEITDSEVIAVSDQNKSGLRILGDLAIKDSDITASGNANNNSISAVGSISITGGTTEIGEGGIASEKNVHIGGVILSNGTPSYDNIQNGSDDVTFLEADYSAVDAAVKKAEALKKEDYTNFETVEEAVQAVVRGKLFWDQDVVDGYAAAIEAALAALNPVPPTEQISYEITEGADQTVIKNGDSSVTIRVNGDFDKFVSVSIDDSEVAEEHYTAVSGSTIITFKPEYIQTLTAGTHRVKIHYTDGLAQTSLILQADEDTEEPPKVPDDDPDDQPDDNPDDQPDDDPDNQPGGDPSDQPDNNPDDKPDNKPSGNPDDKPSDKPSGNPGDQPSGNPSDKPTNAPDRKPSSQTPNTNAANQKAPKTGDDLPIIWLLALAFSYVMIRRSRPGKITKNS